MKCVRTPFRNKTVKVHGNFRILFRNKTERAHGNFHVTLPNICLHVTLQQNIWQGMEISKYHAICHDMFHGEVHGNFHVPILCI